MSHTMLLTRRLTSFLSQNTTPQLPTLLLISPAGKLLSSSSPLPASKLRTQATLACTLWNLYQPLQSSNNDILSTTPSSPQPSSHSQGRSNSIPSVSTSGEDDGHSCVTIQLSDGIMVIRALKCGLLFVAIGVNSLPSVYPSSPTLHSQTHHLSSSTLGSPPASPSPQHAEGHDSLTAESQGDRDTNRNLSGSSIAVLATGAPSDASSVASTTRREQINIMTVKRQANEVGKWLEGSLEGFALSSGDTR